VDRGLDRAGDLKAQASKVVATGAQALARGDIAGARQQASALRDVGRQAIKEGKATGAEVGASARQGLERVKETKAELKK